VTLITIELVAAPFSGGGVNPARVLSAAIVARHWDGYDWLYFVGYSPRVP
jgi:glycerol uptake facilitator-like aquaporin